MCFLCFFAGKQLEEGIPPDEPWTSAREERSRHCYAKLSPPSPPCQATATGIAAPRLEPEFSLSSEEAAILRVMASSAEPTLQKREEEEESSENQPAEDEDTGAQVAPIVRLQEVAVSTGEENEDVLLDLKIESSFLVDKIGEKFCSSLYRKAKLYRFDKEGNQWKERGAGTVKLLKHKETGKVRLVMRQSKTLKICANHLVLPTISMQEHAGNEKSCVWHAADFADGELKEETFCIRFASIENCKTFKDKVEEIAESQQKKDEESEEASSAAKLIEKLSVESNDQEDKPKDKEAPAPAEEKKDEAEKKEKDDDKN
nr:ran-binding protein 1 homolog c-like [Ipomoea trifida]